MINKKMKSKMSLGCALVVAMALVISGCSTGSVSVSNESGSQSSVSVVSNESNVDLSDVTATITLDDDNTTVSGDGVTVDGTDVIITAAGTYSFSGTLTEGRIKVEAEGADVVIILNGVTISNSDKDAIYVETANSATIYVMDGTENTLTSGSEDNYEVAKAAASEANSSDTSEDNVGETESNSDTSTDSSDVESTENDSSESDEEDGFTNSQKAVIMAKCDLSITGSGTLNINGYINNGIQSKTVLTISDVTVNLVAVNDGIKAGEDLVITSGTYNLTTVGDAVQSDGNLEVVDGVFDIVTGDGSASATKKTEAMFGGGDRGGMGGNEVNMIVQMLERMGVEGASDLATALEESGAIDEAPSDMSEIISWLNGLVEDGTISSDYQDTIEAIEDAMSNFTSQMSMGGGRMQGGDMQASTGDAPSGDMQAPTRDASSGDMQAPSGDMPSGDMQMPSGEAPSGDMQMPSGEAPSGDMQATGETSDSTDSSDSAQTPSFRGGGFGMMDEMDSLDSDSNAVSQKGFKAAGTLTITGGTFNIDTVDDAMHAAGDITIDGGTLELASGDDGIHSDTNLTINGGTITVSDSYEGLEGAVITINDGEISITATDDGLNASSSLVDPEIVINGGYLYVDAAGDGLDSNKDLTINGGTVYVDGPADSMNAAIDIGSENQGVFVVNGGTVTAVGMSGMLENAEDTSTQQTITYVFDETLEAGTTITITDSNGDTVAEITTKKNADSITYSSSDLVNGETYTFTAGDLSGSITADDINATNSSGGMMGGMGGGHMGGGMRNDNGGQMSAPESVDSNSDSTSGN